MGVRRLIGLAFAVGLQGLGRGLFVRQPLRAALRGGVCCGVCCCVCCGLCCRRLLRIARGLRCGFALRRAAAPTQLPVDQHADGREGQQSKKYFAHRWSSTATVPPA
jgi:hypothetical protein